MDHQNYNVDSTTTEWIKKSAMDSSSNVDYSTRMDPNEIPTVNSTNPNYHPSSTNNTHQWEKNSSIHEANIDKVKGDLKKGQQQVEDIITKSKRILGQQWEQTRHSLGQVQRKLKEMTPKQANHIIYWQNPIQSGIVFSVLLAFVVTFMFLSSLAAVSFWLLASLIVVGLYKLYNYVLATFLGRVQDDVFDSIFASDLNISERQAQALANSIRANGTTLLRQARSLFLWNNLTNSTLFGLVLFLCFYIGLSMNALTFVLVGLIFLFTVPKIYHVYQAPIDRLAQQILDQINQISAKVSPKGSIKPKKA